MKENLKIPDDKRHIFSQPLGTLITGNRNETIQIIVKKFEKLEKEGKSFEFFIVGDIVSKDFLSNDFLSQFVRICIIDGKTQRNEIKINYEDIFKNVISVENPKGIISDEAWNVLETVIKSKDKTIIKITKGEEDILVLPLVLEIPLEENINKFVFYGQPPITDSLNPIPEGIVLVEVTKKIQKTVKTFINLMDKLNQ